MKIKFIANNTYQIRNDVERYFIINDYHLGRMLSIYFNDGSSKLIKDLDFVEFLGV